MTESVAKDKVVAIKYVLTNSTGEIVDRSGDEPMEYLHGAGNIVPGLEKQLAGKSIGDKLTAEVPPEEGYGPKHDIKPQKVPRSAFPEGAMLEKGMSYSMRTEEGRAFPICDHEGARPDRHGDARPPARGPDAHVRRRGGVDPRRRAGGARARPPARARRTRALNCAEHLDGMRSGRQHRRKVSTRAVQAPRGGTDTLTISRVFGSTSSTVGIRSHSQVVTLA